MPLAVARKLAQVMCRHSTTTTLLLCLTSYMRLQATRKGMPEGYNAGKTTTHSHNGHEHTHDERMEVGLRASI